jgi:hypothetical protein
MVRKHQRTRRRRMRKETRAVRELDRRSAAERTQQPWEEERLGTGQQGSSAGEQRAGTVGHGLGAWRADRGRKRGRLGEESDCARRKLCWRRRTTSGHQRRAAGRTGRVVERHGNRGWAPSGWEPERGWRENSTSCAQGKGTPLVLHAMAELEPGSSAQGDSRGTTMAGGRSSGALCTWKPGSWAPNKGRASSWRREAERERERQGRAESRDQARERAASAEGDKLGAAYRGAPTSS